MRSWPAFFSAVTANLDVSETVSLFAPNSLFPSTSSSSRQRYLLPFFACVRCAGESVHGERKPPILVFVKFFTLSSRFFPELGP